MEGLRDKVMVSKVSIIVPIYNVEPYLRGCIDSILGQTFKDFKLILVDDGSTDGCAKICDEYALKDERIMVFHKENGGLSDARNFGIEHSDSLYVAFIDSDDTVEPDMFEVLYKNITESCADVSVCGLFDCYTDKKVPQCDEKHSGILLGKEALGEALEGRKFSVNAVNKLYKKELFNNIKFPIGKLSEDAFIIPKILASANKVVYTTEPKYNYMHRKGTITTSEFKKKDLNVIEGYEDILVFVEKNFPNFKCLAESRLIWAYIYILDKMILSENFDSWNEYKIVVGFLKRNVLKIVFNSFFSFKRKVSIICLLMNKGLYSSFIKYNSTRQKSLFD